MTRTATKTTSLLAAVLIAFVFVGCTSKPGKPSREEACGRVISSSAPGQPTRTRGARAIYSSGSDLRLFDFSSNSQTSLNIGHFASSGRSPNGLRPRFRDAQSVSFAELRVGADDLRPFGEDSLYETHLSNGGSTEILRLPADLRGYDWSPDGKRLAYQIPTVGSTVSIALCLFDSVSGTTKQLRILGTDTGTSVSQDDEQSIAWSPQGTSILVVDTLENPSLYVIDEKGRNLVPPREGTFARWFPDGRKLLFRDLSDPGHPGRWSTLEVGSGKTRSLGIPAGTFRPRISPGGQLIAYDDGDAEAPSAYLYDVAKGTHHLLIHGYGAPIWFGPGQIAATAGGPCPKNAECNDWWVPLNRTVAINIEGGTPRPLSLTSTLQEAHVFSNIDVFGLSSG